MKKITDIFKSHLYMMKLAFNSNGFPYILLLFVMILTYLMPTIELLATGKLLNTFQNLTSDSKGTVFTWLAVCVILKVFSYLFASLKYNYREIVCQKSENVINELIMKQLGKKDASYMDDPKNADIIESVNVFRNLIYMAPTWFAESFGSLFTFVVCLITFLAYDPVIAVVFLLTFVPSIIVNIINSGKMDRYSVDSIPQNRKKDYYKAILTNRYWAGDVRIYKLKDFFLSRYIDLWNEISHERRKIFAKYSVIMAFADIVNLLGLVFIIIYSLRQCLSGTILIGTLTVYIGIAQNCGNCFFSFVTNIVAQMNVSVPHIMDFISFVSDDNTFQNSGELDLPKHFSIEFENVSFSYPNGEKVIDDLSLRIPDGQTVALLGENGAGKTTLIYLLLGIYCPTNGRILFNGIDMAEYDVAKLRRRFGICFQNTEQFALTVRENIALADLDKQNDKSRLDNAINACDLKDVIESLENGLDTPTSKRFDNSGVVFSGGQWQKIAISRAFFSDSSFLILDEPSSSLDPISEDNIFKSFGKWFETRGGIIVTHRMSCANYVDRIIYLENGRIIEDGTHSELMRLGDKYARLYTAQAELYTKGIADEKF